MENLLAQRAQLSYAIVTALAQTGKTDTNVIAQVFLNSNPKQSLRQQEQVRESSVPSKSH
jgi:hypothetical protein